MLMENMLKTIATAPNMAAVVMVLTDFSSL